jgi:hypothetical protein
VLLPFAEVAAQALFQQGGGQGLGEDGRGGAGRGSHGLAQALLPLPVEQVQQAFLGQRPRRRSVLVWQVCRGEVAEGDLQEMPVPPELDGFGMGGVVADLDLLAGQGVVAEVTAVLPVDQGGAVHAAGGAQQEGGLHVHGVEAAQWGGVFLPGLARAPLAVPHAQGGMGSAVVERLQPRIPEAVQLRQGGDHGLGGHLRDEALLRCAEKSLHGATGLGVAHVRADEADAEVGAAALDQGAGPFRAVIHEEHLGQTAAREPALERFLDEQRLAAGDEARDRDEPGAVVNDGEQDGVMGLAVLLEAEGGQAEVGDPEVIARRGFETPQDAPGVRQPPQVPVQGRAVNLPLPLGVQAPQQLDQRGCAAPRLLLPEADRFVQGRRRERAQGPGVPAPLRGA